MSPALSSPLTVRCIFPSNPISNIGFPYLFYTNSVSVEQWVFEPNVLYRPSLILPTASILSTHCCPGGCQGKETVPMDSCQEPGWGLCSGLTVALSSYISQELELSASLPRRIYFSSSKTKKFENTWSPIFLINKSPPFGGKILLTLSGAMIYGK